MHRLNAESEYRKTECHSTSTILPNLKRVWITVSVILELRLPLPNFLSPAFVVSCSLSSPSAVLVCISFAGPKKTTTENKQKYRILLLPTQ